MRKAGIVTETYETGNEDFMVDIIRMEDKGDEVFGAWLYRSHMGMKMFMYGVPARVMSYQDFIDSVKANMDEYFEDYDEEVH